METLSAKLRELLAALGHAVRRRPIRIVEAVLAVLIVYGIVDAGDAEQLLEQLGELIALAGTIFGLERIQKRRTTPLYDPRDNDGTPLLAGDAEHALRQARDDGAFRPSPDGDPEGR